jgi:hypothetical protein
LYFGIKRTDKGGHWGGKWYLSCEGVDHRQQRRLELQEEEAKHVKCEGTPLSPPKYTPSKENKKV